VLLSLVLFAVASPAQGADGTSPWSGGATRLSRLEEDGSLIARSIAGADALVECLDPTRWRELGGESGFDPVLTWAMTPMRWDTESAHAAPVGVTRLSPRTCRLVEAFRKAPTEVGSRLCVHGSPASRQQVGECDGWGSKLLAVHVLTHESIHLAGVVDEAVTDCLAVQLDALVAGRLGASNAFSRSFAGEYWRHYYPTQERRYRSSECRDGRSLDLFPDLRGWPTPTAYPRDVVHRLGAFADARANYRMPDV
jgi:hypothetical protein